MKIIFMWKIFSIDKENSFVSAERTEWWEQMYKNDWNESLVSLKVRLWLDTNTAVNLVPPRNIQQLSPASDAGVKLQNWTLLL